MAEQTSRNKVNIGLSSLILIFIVLCLSTFGLLSLSSARGDLELAERGAQAAKEFYEADERIKAAVDFITSEKMLAVGQEENLKRLQAELLNKDWFMTLLDLKAYTKAK